MIRFDFGLLLQGQMRIAKCKSAYNSLIIGPTGLKCKQSYRKSWAGNLLVWSRNLFWARNFLMWSDLTLGPCFSKM